MVQFALGTQHLQRKLELQSNEACMPITEDIFGKVITSCGHEINNQSAARSGGGTLCTFARESLVVHVETSNFTIFCNYQCAMNYGILPDSLYPVQYNYLCPYYVLGAISGIYSAKRQNEYISTVTSHCLINTFLVKITSNLEIVQDLSTTTTLLRKKFCFPGMQIFLSNSSLSFVKYILK